MADLITRQRGTIKAGELHPGAAVALRRFRMNETDVAQAIREGELASPQQFENVWLFRLRITGTGTAFRPKHDEHVYRPPEDYLNDEFLQRCLGLPVVLEHPKKQVLDSQEFADRIIGTIVLAWIEQDEVWGVAKIYDQNAARYMVKHQLSTSPAVVFRYKDETEKVATPDGKHLLIEGRPSLLDHLAICEEGVWDKGGPPSGVDVSGATTRSDSMADEKDKDEREREEEQRADAAAGEKLDKLLKGIDSLHSRMDTLSSRMDAYDDRARDDRARDDRARDDRARDDRARDDRRRDDKRRDDRRADADEDKAELERRQAKDLRQLAEEEEDEAEDKEEGRDDRRRDDRKRDDDRRTDRRRDDAEDEDEKEEEEERTDHRRDDAEDEDEKEEEEEEEERDDRKRDDKRRDGRARDDRRRDDRKRDDKRRDDRARDDRRRDDRKRDDRRRDDNVDEGFNESATEHEHVRHDSLARLERDVDILKRRTANRSDEEEAAFADAQARADEVYAAHGKHAPRPMTGETLTGYRIRLARTLQPYSKAWKDTDLLAIARSDATAFSNIEQMIYADAATEGRNPTTVPLGSLREVRKRGPGGREIIEFVGDPLSWMSPFMAPGAAAQRLGIRRP